MKLTHDGEKFVFKCSYETHHFAKDARFRWNPLTREWWTSSLTVAARLRQYADEKANTQFNHSIIDVKPWAGGFDYNKKNTPYAFQLDAVTWALTRNKSYLGLDPGCGKSICAAIIAGTLKQNVIYICPPFLVENTIYEFQKWLPPGWINFYRLDVIPDSMVWRLKPGVVQSIGRATKEETILIIDEAHRFKNLSSKRSKAVISMTGRYEKTVFMSGTPMPNRPIELYSVLSAAAHETIDYMDKHQYGLKYCNAFFNEHGWDYSGASNMKELAARVTEKFMLRLKKEKVLKELPEKRQEIVVIAKDLPAKAIALEQKMLKDYSPARGTLPDGENVARYRRTLGTFKAKLAAEFTRDILETECESVLLFAYHKDVIAKLSDLLKDFNPIIITGATPSGERQALVNEFQLNKKLNLFIGNYLACGVGFTITKATRVIFAEYSWVPGENEQAQDRTHRIGQKNSVLVQYLVYKNSFDREVLETNLRKMKNISHLEGAKENE